MMNKTAKVNELARKAQWDESVVDNNYDFLFEYFLNEGEMPYGVAKARTGDPYQWISNKLCEIYRRENDTVVGQMLRNV